MTGTLTDTIIGIYRQNLGYLAPSADLISGDLGQLLLRVHMPRKDAYFPLTACAPDAYQPEVLIDTLSDRLQRLADSPEMAGALLAGSRNIRQYQDSRRKQKELGPCSEQAYEASLEALCGAGRQDLMFHFLTS